MDERLRNLVNEIWDREAAKHPMTEDINTHDAVVASELGIPKWKVLHARRGYVRRPSAHPANVRAVNSNAPYSGYCSTTFRKVNVTLPRVSMLENAA